LSLFAGYGWPAIATVAMLSEISSLFLNYKEMFSKESRNTPIAQANQLAFFFTFLIFRVVLFAILTYKCFQMLLLTVHLVSWIRIVTMVPMLLLAVAGVILNMYWFRLILKGLKRLMQERGILAKP